MVYFNQQFDLFIKLIEFTQKALSKINYYVGLLGRILTLTLLLPVYYLLIHPLAYYFYLKEKKHSEKLLKVINRAFERKVKLSMEDKKMLFKIYRYYNNNGTKFKETIDKFSGYKKIPLVFKPIYRLIHKNYIIIKNVDDTLSAKLYAKISVSDNSKELKTFEQFADGWNDESMDIYDIKYGTVFAGK